MLKIKVVDTELETRSGTSSRTGKPFNFIQQTNIFVEINGETRRFPQIIEDGKQPYAVGSYLIDVEKHIRVNDFGSLVVEPYARFKFIVEPSDSTSKTSFLDKSRQAA